MTKYANKKNMHILAKNHMKAICTNMQTKICTICNDMHFQNMHKYVRYAFYIHIYAIYA